MAEVLLQKREAMLRSFFKSEDCSNHDSRWNDQYLHSINNLYC